MLRTAMLSSCSRVAPRAAGAGARRRFFSASRRSLGRRAARGLLCVARLARSGCARAHASRAASLWRATARPRPGVAARRPPGRASPPPPRELDDAELDLNCRFLCARRAHHADARGRAPRCEPLRHGACSAQRAPARAAAEPAVTHASASVVAATGAAEGAQLTDESIVCTCRIDSGLPMDASAARQSARGATRVHGSCNRQKFY